MKDELKLAAQLLYKMEFEELTKEEYQQLQFLLITNEPYFRNQYPLTKTTITGDKMMYISDTHFGGQCENKALVTFAYDKALQENIKTVVHLGDLIEAGANRQYDKKLETIQEELQTAITCMPDEIQTKLLLGNHDYSAVRTYPSLVPTLFKYSKLEILGMKEVIVNWDKLVSLSLCHPIRQIAQLDFNRDSELLQLCGHYHESWYEENEQILKLPCLCKDEFDIVTEQLKNLAFTGWMKPLFVIASKQSEDVVAFTTYEIERGFLDHCRVHETVELNVKTKQIKKYPQK